MTGLLGEGYDELLSDKLVRGTGTSEPWGIQGKITTISGSEVVTTTDGALGEVDVYKVWDALPARFRGNASWMMTVGTNTRSAAWAPPRFSGFTVTLPAGAADELMGRPVYTTPYGLYDWTTTTTGQADLVLVGDFRNYVVARRAGMRGRARSAPVRSGHRPPERHSWPVRLGPRRR